MSKMLNVEVQLKLKMPGSLIPAWVQRRAEHYLTPDRLTPAKYRFVAAAALHASDASTNREVCLEKSPTS